MNLETNVAFLLRAFTRWPGTLNQRVWVSRKTLDRLNIRARISPHGKNFLITDGDGVTNCLAGGLASQFGFNVYRRRDAPASGVAAS